MQHMSTLQSTGESRDTWRPFQDGGEAGESADVLSPSRPGVYHTSLINGGLGVDPPFHQRHESLLWLPMPIETKSD